MEATVINREIIQLFLGTKIENPVKCEACGRSWVTRVSKTGHNCRVLDVYKAGCYVWYVVVDGLLVPVKFGWGDCLIESLRFLSLPADYTLHANAKFANSDKKYARMVNKALDDKQYDKELHLTTSYVR